MNAEHALQQNKPVLIVQPQEANIKILTLQCRHCSEAKRSTAQSSTAQHSTAQHSTAQHSTAQHSTAQHSTAQHTWNSSSWPSSMSLSACVTDQPGCPASFQLSRASLASSFILAVWLLLAFDASTNSEPPGPPVGCASTAADIPYLTQQHTFQNISNVPYSCLAQQ